MIRPLARSKEEELLDRGDLDLSDLSENLRDLARVGRWPGGNRMILARLMTRLAAWPRDREIRILDVGAGGCDLSLALRGLCERLSLRSRIVCLDRAQRILDVARVRVGDHSGIDLVRGDALVLPFLPGTFDFVLCSLVLHHIPPEQGADFLRGLGAVAREGVLVSDLRRGRWEYFWIYLLSRAFFSGRVTRNDAPLSVLRSLTLAEARSLLVEVGWNRGRAEKCFPLRLFLLDRPMP